MRELHVFALFDIAISLSIHHAPRRWLQEAVADAVPALQGTGGEVDDVNDVYDWYTYQLTTQ